MKTFLPAFPSQSDEKYYHGLSQRAYIASVALQGLCSGLNYRPSGDIIDTVEIVEDAVALADSLIARLADGEDS
jgi:hypothetical protein